MDANGDGEVSDKEYIQTQMKTIPVEMHEQAVSQLSTHTERTQSTHTHMHTHAHTHTHARAQAHTHTHKHTTNTNHSFDFTGMRLRGCLWMQGDLIERSLRDVAALRKERRNYATTIHTLVACASVSISD